MALDQAPGNRTGGSLKRLKEMAAGDGQPFE